MDKYKTIADFSDASTIMAMIYSVASAVPPFFAIAVFVFWIFGSASAYFAILRLTTKKRFFHVATSMSFACFVISLLLASMNNLDDYGITVLNGYWVAFYILMTALSFLGLSFYKNS